MTVVIKLKNRSNRQIGLCTGIQKGEGGREWGGGAGGRGLLCCEYWDV